MEQIPLPYIFLSCLYETEMANERSNIKALELPLERLLPTTDAVPPTFHITAQYRPQFHGIYLLTYLLTYLLRRNWRTVSVQRWKMNSCLADWKRLGARGAGGLSDEARPMRRLISGLRRVHFPCIVRTKHAVCNQVEKRINEPFPGASLVQLTWRAGVLTVKLCGFIGLFHVISPMHTADATSCVASASAVWTQFATSSRRLSTDSVDNLENWT